MGGVVAHESGMLEDLMKKNDIVDRTVNKDGDLSAY